MSQLSLSNKLDKITSILNYIIEKKITTWNDLINNFQLSKNTLKKYLKGPKGKKRWANSINNHGKYITLLSIIKNNKDDNNIWVRDKITFSYIGNVTETIIWLIERSKSGLTASEIDNYLHLYSNKILSKIYQKKYWKKINKSQRIVREKDRQVTYIYYFVGKKKQQELNRLQSNRSSITSEISRDKLLELKCAFEFLRKEEVIKEKTFQEFLMSGLNKMLFTAEAVPNYKEFKERYDRGEIMTEYKKVTIGKIPPSVFRYIEEYAKEIDEKPPGAIRRILQEWAHERCLEERNRQE